MSENPFARCVLRAAAVVLLLAVVLLACSVSSGQQGKGPGKAKLPDFIPEGYDDYQNMLTQLGIKKMRKGRDARAKDTSNEATANPYKETMPDLMTFKDGTKVTTADQWPKRRAEIVEDFEREVYGRIPKNIPKVKWEITNKVDGESDGIATVTKTLVGHVDNSAFPKIKVDIQANFTVPKNAAGRVPILLQFGFGFGSGRGRAGPNPWTQQALNKGWGYGTIVPVSIQGDNNRLREGIIGLCNKGQPRKPDDWGALRAWAWGVSCLIDYFEANPDSGVDPAKVSITGVSRYGKAALVATAFDTRIAAGFVASSGAGGAKLFRRDFGELLENLAGRGGYHWMAGNFLKYAADEADFGKKTAADLPVDQHELIALCAPRLCFVSYGVPNGAPIGDPNWVDAHGSFMAAVLAGPAYRLLGKKDLGTPGDYLTDKMPPVNTLIGGELAWRQHSGGHTNVPNFPAFFEWAGHYISAPAVRKSAPAQPAVKPAARTDANSKLAHEQMLANLKKGRIDVYFAGDSITRRWRATEYPQFLAHWNKNFFGWNAANFGWGGDTIQNILWRLQNGELDGVHPKVIVLLAGTNNVGRFPASDAKAVEITTGIKALLDTMREKAPKATIIVMGVLPRNDGSDPKAVMASINRINENIAKFADGKTIRYLDINDKLADKDGMLFEGMTVDRLHLSLKGYQVWADALKPLFTELLGPPAAEDHAPPPTGDPSATRSAAGGNPGGA